jgi:endonuclease/exonuclease/phosphatase (EEP) superfamily protein YafD
VLWQGTKIWPYTPLAPVQVLPSRTRRPGSRAGGTLRLLISNLLMENRQHHRFLSLVRRHDPDLVLALEVSTEWMEALEPLAEAYPHAIRYPQDNYYGMALFSRLPLREAEVRFLVQEDIPSIRATFELPGGVPVRLYGLHPRPPEPIRRQSSAPRDAELVRVGHEIRAAESHPAIVAGDLNDVAWSPVSELFLRLSGLLDPRRGRGFFNSFDANNPFFRFPLDHVFHSNHFKLVDLRRLEKIGSDHFPIYVELSYEPAAEREQPRTALEPGDEEVAREKLDEEREEAATGRDLPQRDG